MERLMISANRLLSRGKAEESIVKYNKVLYDLSPGHVGALLNRSLAYIWMGYHELAAADAYTAYLASRDMRNFKIAHNNKRLSETCRYLRAERLEVDAKEEWTLDGEPYVGDQWAASPLSSIVINELPDISEFKIPLAQVAKFKVSYFPLDKREGVCEALEVRAMYRLAGALYLCGGGARNEAMGFLDDALTSCKTTAWEILYFRALGDEIMKDIMTEISKGSRIVDEVGLSHDTNAMEDSPYFVQALRTLQMKSKFLRNATTLNHKGYAMWDTFEPDLLDTGWQAFIRKWISQATRNCKPHFTRPEDSNDDKFIPYVELRACRAINRPEMVLSEPTAFNLTTDDPEKSFDRRNDDDGHQQYCDTCATLMNIEEGYVRKYQRHMIPATPKQRPASTPPAASVSSPDSISSMTTSSGDGPATSPPLFGAPSSDAAAASSPEPPKPPPYRALTQQRSPEFMFCSENHFAPTCTKECRTGRLEFDQGLCGTFIENKIRQIHLSPLFKVGSDEERKTDCLHDLILLRLMTIAINTGRHPLHAPDIVLATAGLNKNRNPDPPRVWTFKKNVSRPLIYIHELLTRLGKDPYASLRLYEPWIINTLLYKIRSATRITAGPRYVKFFHPTGKVDAAYELGAKRKDEHNVPHTPAEKKVRVGRLNSVFNMIRVADPEKGELPNIAVVQRENMECFAIRRIEVGEPLLRMSDKILEECYAALSPKGSEKAGDDNKKSNSEKDKNGKEDEEDKKGKEHEKGQKGKEDERKSTDNSGDAEDLFTAADAQICLEILEQCAHEDDAEMCLEILEQYAREDENARRGI